MPGTVAGIRRFRARDSRLDLFEFHSPEPPKSAYLNPGISGFGACAE